MEEFYINNDNKHRYIQAGPVSFHEDVIIMNQCQLNGIMFKSKAEDKTGNSVTFFKDQFHFYVMCLMFFYVVTMSFISFSSLNPFRHGWVEPVPSSISSRADYTLQVGLLFQSSGHLFMVITAPLSTSGRMVPAASIHFVLVVLLISHGLHFAENKCHISAVFWVVNLIL